MMQSADLTDKSFQEVSRALAEIHPGEEHKTGMIIILPSFTHEAREHGLTHGRTPYTKLNPACWEYRLALVHGVYSEHCQITTIYTQAEAEIRRDLDDDDFILIKEVTTSPSATSADHLWAEPDPFRPRTTRTIHLSAEPDPLRPRHPNLGFLCDGDDHRIYYKNVENHRFEDPCVCLSRLTPASYKCFSKFIVQLWGVRMGIETESFTEEAQDREGDKRGTI